MVQPFGLGTGVLAIGVPVGVEPPPGTGAPALPDAIAHDRIRCGGSATERANCHESGSSAPASGYGPPTTATSFKMGRFTGADFPLQPDGTLRCPAGQSLTAHEWRREADGSLRVVYGASLRSCRPCALRAQCQWNGSATAKPRQVSLLLHPLPVGSAPLLWRDWSRRLHRRACIGLLRHQRVEITLPQTMPAEPRHSEGILSRAERAHSRLSWEARLACNARAPTTDRPTIKLFGVPETFATFLGLPTA